MPIVTARVRVAACALLALATLASSSVAEPAISHVANLRYLNGSDVELATIAGRDYAFAGQLNNSVRVIDVTDPRAPVEVSRVPCALNQNDVQLSGTTLVIAADATGTCTLPNGSMTTVLGFATADVSDPTRPRVLGKASVSRGAHNVTVHPTQPVVYVSNSDRTTEAVIHIWDISSPATPVRIKDWTYTRLGSPHDITFNASGTRAYAAAREHTDIIDTTDPRNPRLISSIHDPAVTLSHQADPTPDGRYLLVADELGGGMSPMCPGGGVHVYDIRDEARPVKAGAFWADTVGPALGLACTAHVFRIAPDGRTMTIAWYNAGVHVVDITDLASVAAAGSGSLTGRGPRTLASIAMPSTDVWAAKPWPERHPGYIFANDLNRGFDVYFVPALAR